MNVLEYEGRRFRWTPVNDKMVNLFPEGKPDQVRHLVKASAITTVSPAEDRWIHFANLHSVTSLDVVEAQAAEQLRRKLNEQDSVPDPGPPPEPDSSFTRYEDTLVVSREQIMSGPGFVMEAYRAVSLAVLDQGWKELVDPAHPDFSGNGKDVTVRFTVTLHHNDVGSR